MGTYLNPGAEAFLMGRNSRIYVDKTGILFRLNEVVNTEQRFVCISRPRRFGKSMTANMICAYYDRTVEGNVFSGLKISRNFQQQGKDAVGMSWQGKFNVIRINMQDFLSRTASMQMLLQRIQLRLVREITKAYPEADYVDKDSLAEVMGDSYEYSGTAYVIVIDEWDCVFREYPHDKKAQKEYLDFLRDWLKDKTYISLAYMTGILPIKKYGTHSALNMFFEYSMEHPDQYAEFVGFTQEETRQLCEAYQMDFEECQAWYDGYSFSDCAHIYGPKSVVDAMLRHRFGSYWNNTETYEALKAYIDLNEDGLRDSIIELMGGGRKKINTGTFQNDMTSIHSADDVMTLLVHLGYLGYDSLTEEVFIPNNEVMREFVNATDQGKEWEIISQSIRASDDLLLAVWNGEEEKVAQGIEKAHFETSVIQYNDENALSYVLSLAFYSARRYYNIVRELPAGKGFADLVFFPRPSHRDKPVMIVELKWDASADSAIRQIHERRYAWPFADHKGKMILVGVNYDRESKNHSCKIEFV